MSNAHGERDRQRNVRGESRQRAGVFLRLSGGRIGARQAKRQAVAEPANGVGGPVRGVVTLQ